MNLQESSVSAGILSKVTLLQAEEAVTLHGDEVYYPSKTNHYYVLDMSPLE